MAYDADLVNGSADGASANNGVLKESDIPYTRDAGSAQKLDLYRLRTGAADSSSQNSIASVRPKPLVVFIHGGGWMEGDKSFLDERIPLMDVLLQNGYLIASVNYRLATESPWPAQINDCKSAIRFLRNNASQYGIDPNRIVVFGESAGAHLAMMLGVTNGNTQFVNTKDGNGAATSADIQAVISDYGISDVNKWGQFANDDTDAATNAKELLLGHGYTTEQALQASPVTYVNTNTVPMLLAHGKSDTTVSYEQSVLMEHALEESHVYSATWYPDEGGHSSYDVFVQNTTAEKKYLDFLAAVIPDPASRFKAQKMLPVYRFYDTVNGSHMFTADADEVSVLSQDWSGYRSEGIVFHVMSSSAHAEQSIVCLHNDISGDYVYTTKSAEVTALTASGWTQLGVMNVPTDGNVPVYRLYDPHSDRHILVTEGTEKTYLLNNGCENEGIIFNALS